MHARVISFYGRFIALIETPLVKFQLLCLYYNFSRYKENMIELHTIVNDSPYDFMDNLVWWTEYIIRHKGAPHLRSNLARQPWYQRCDMDIVVFLTIVAFIVVSNVLSLSAKIIVRIYKRQDTYSASQKQKLS